jgi:hypothetical protein
MNEEQQMVLIIFQLQIIIIILTLCLSKLTTIANILKGNG